MPATTHRARLLLALAAVATMTACIPLPGGRTLSQRVVAGKVGDAFFVTHDGATCAVPQRTFARVQVGDTQTCAWQALPSNTVGGGVGDPALNGRRPIGRPLAQPEVSAEARPARTP